MNGAPTAKPPQFNPKSPLLEEAGSQPPTSRILRESKSTISRPRGWQGQPEVINFLRLPPPVCVYFRQFTSNLKASHPIPRIGRSRDQKGRGESFPLQAVSRQQKTRLNAGSRLSAC